MIVSGDLPVDATLPSTRALAKDLGVSRGVVVRAYAQLAAEGYLGLRRNAAPTVVAHAHAPEPPPAETDVPIAGVRFNLRPDLPDLGLFPRAQWQRSMRAALARAANTDLAYGEPFGAAALRRELAPFLSRTRGVAAEMGRTAVFAGSTQALYVLACVLREQGARRIAVEDPGHRWRTRALRLSGLDVVPVPVDKDGLRIEDIPAADAVVVTPDHQFPLGVALSAERRRALVEWATAGDRLVIEHDYDGHFRHDRPAAGTLQALAPDHIVYVGSASALLVPALRIGWAVLPARLVIPIANRMFGTNVATSRITQLTLAEFVGAGYLDRHLRKARTAYRRRRQVALAALARQLPDATVSSAPVGIFVSVRIRGSEGKLLERARARGIAVDGLNEHALTRQRAGLAVGFAALPEPTLRRAIAALASA